MLLNAYSVYDRKALQYHAPFFTHTDGSAVRMFSDLANDIGTTIGRHPADYVLYQVGTYSDQNGSLEPAMPLRHVMDAAAVLHIQPNLFGRGESTLEQRAPLGAANGHVENLSRGVK